MSAALDAPAAAERAAPFGPELERLLDGAPTRGIRAHKLGALAARQRRLRGEPVEPALAADERGAGIAVVTARPLLETIRATCDGPLVLIKGPEVARFYPGAARSFADIDLIVPTAHDAQRALLAAGFEEVDDPDLFHDHHHLRPLKSPSLGLKVEIHLAPLWPEGDEPPPVDEIVERSQPSATGVEGITAPDPVHHALILAAHSWSHDPLTTLRDLVDVAAVSAGCSDDDLQRTADAWRLGRVWRTSRAANEALFEGGRRTVPLRTWARHLDQVRERTVLDNHAMRLMHPFWERSALRASADLAAGFRKTLTPAPGESWSEKLTRTRHAIRHVGEPMSTHLDRIGRRSGD